MLAFLAMSSVQRLGLPVQNSWVVCKHTDPFWITQSDVCQPLTYTTASHSRSNLLLGRLREWSCSLFQSLHGTVFLSVVLLPALLQSPPECQRAWSVKLLYICREVASTSGVLAFWMRPVGLYPADRPMGLKPVVARPTWTKPEARDTAGRRRNLPDVTRSP